MHAVQDDPAPHAAPIVLLLASANAGWCEEVEAAITERAGGSSIACWRLNRFSDIESFLGLPAKLWIVDEAWLAPVLAHRRAAALERVPSPDLIVLFPQYSSARVVAMIESGARGCLSSLTSIDEVVRAIDAVLAGELWLSRSVFAEVLTHVMNKLPAPQDSDGQEELTDRQREIVRCVGRGMSNKQIGRHLGISPTTVKTHLHNIFQRVGVGGRTMLALRANDGGSDEHAAGKGRGPASAVASTRTVAG